MPQTLPTELITIGYLSTILQQSPGKLSERLTMLRIKPTVRINGVSHYPGDVVRRLRDMTADPRN